MHTLKYHSRHFQSSINILINETVKLPGTGFFGVGGAVEGLSSLQNSLTLLKLPLRAVSMPVSLSCSDTPTSELNPGWNTMEYSWSSCAK